MNSRSRKYDIDTLITQIQSQYAEIESLYNASLQEKEIKPELKVKVKNYLENARSILDYCAHDIADVCSITSKDIYFPIVAKDKDKTSFDGSIGRNLPDLESKNKKVFDYLESIQPYYANYAWLADFATVTSDNKHSQLTPQTRIETPLLSIEHQGTGIRLLGGASISVGQGASISLGGATIMEGQTISPNSQQIYGDPRLKVKKEIWVDFLLNATISALPLLKKIHDEIPKMIDQVYKLL